MILPLMIGILLKMKLKIFIRFNEKKQCPARLSGNALVTLTSDM